MLTIFSAILVSQTNQAPQKTQAAESASSGLLVPTLSPDQQKLADLYVHLYSKLPVSGTGFYANRSFASGKITVKLYSPYESSKTNFLSWISQNGFNQIPSDSFEYVVVNTNTLPTSTPTPLPKITNLQPVSGTISSGTRNITWSSVAGAIKYYLRIDNTSDAWVCNGVLPSGDVCITQTGTSYSYNFKTGNTYNIWVHPVFNTAGTVYADPTNVRVTVVNPTPTPLPMPTNLQPSTSITSGTRNITWNSVVGAKKYYLRIDDLSDAWVCSGVTPSGDVCLTQTRTYYSYNFKSGHKYNIWVHAVFDDAGTIYSNPANTRISVY